MTEYYSASELALDNYETQQAIKIYEWKNGKLSVLSETLGKALKPLNSVIDKLVPRNAVAGALDLANAAARFTADYKDLLKEAGVSDLKEIGALPLQRSDALADRVHNWAIAMATGEGAAAGALGIFAIPADIPALVFLSLRTVHKIGLCYGYELEGENEKQFTYAVLQAAGANSVEEKIAALAILRQAQMALLRVAWKNMSGLGVQGALIVVRNLAKQLGINITKRKALQAIPFIGAGVGAAVNGTYINDIGWAARRAFQERKLTDQGKLSEIYGPQPGNSQAY
jgi:uncharacterized protein (DUF697 family)